MSKGNETRERILDHAVDLTTVLGLEGLSIGELAKASHMSKSGLYAHFTSKEDLQLNVILTARHRFVDAVLSPALSEARGEPRIRALFENWLFWEEKHARGGCPFVAAAHELDDRPGPVREALVASQRDWIDTLAQAAQVAIDEGHFRSDLDTDQLAYEIYALFLAFHTYHRLLRDTKATSRARTTFDALICRSRKE